MGLESLRLIIAFLRHKLPTKSLQIAKNTSPVATANALQAREPIHSHPIDHWLHYKPFVKALISLLEAENINAKSSL